MDVFCFDFDGVICDSAPETAEAAWRAGGGLWPDQAGELPAALAERFCRLRPVIHTGHEAVPLMRLIVTGEATDEAILDGFEALRDALMAREGLSGEELLARFGDARDRMIAADREGWLRRNRFYPGMAALVRRAGRRGEAFVITTKQERFASLLLAHHGAPLPPERVYGLERGRSKPEILAGLRQRPGLRGGRFHFIEDRLETLKQVLGVPALDAVCLYLAEWGYNTAPQRAEATARERIEVVSRERFAALAGLEDTSGPAPG